MTKMKRYWIVAALLLLIPVVALALDDASERFAMGRQYYPGSDLTTAYGRFAMGGQYLPGGASASSSGTINYGVGGVRGKTPALGHHTR